MNRLLVLLAVLLAACASPTPTPTPLLSAWGDIITLGQAEQMDAPSLWAFPDRTITAWIGADDTGIHQDTRTMTKDGLSARVVLPLPPKNPYAQQMYPAEDDNVHVLWLDANPDGQVRLFGAVITPELKVERGPTPITEQITRRYTVLPNGDGSLWVISSGGLPIEPELYARYLDPQGRPRFGSSDPIATDADWPALTQANDSTIYLFWIRPSNGEVMRSIIVNGIPENPQPIAETVALNAGDRLISFSAGLDQSLGYLFWNVSRADGQAETWITSGALDADTWDKPKRFGIDKTKGNFETGFNSGTASAARGGSQWLSWGAPLAGQFEVLPLAVVNDGKLGIAYLQNGAAVGYQDIASISGLIGMPSLLTDRDRFLYLAWSEPTAAGKANLKLTTTRRF
jgi:hypothetical protein